MPVLVAEEVGFVKNSRRASHKNRGQDRPDLPSSFLNLPRYELNAWDDGSMKLRGMMMPANTLGVEPEGVAERQGAKPQHHILNTRYGSRYFAGIASQQHTSNQLVSGNPCFHFFKPVSSTETPVSSRHRVRNFVPIVLSGTQDRRIAEKNGRNESESHSLDSLNSYSRSL